MAKVLVVDDEKIIRERLKKLLDMDGYETFIAENGQEGMDIFRKEKPEIALVDIKMPGMDGIEMLKRIRKKSRETEVIIITGHGGVGTAIQALREGAFSYIQKPIEYDELEIDLKKALEKQRMQRKLDEYIHSLEKVVKEKTRELRRRKKAEEKLKQSADEWSNTFDSISDLIFIQNKDSIIIKVNKAFAETIKAKPEDIIGKKCYEVFHKLDSPWPDCPFERTKKDKKPHTLEVDDPNIGFPLLISISPIFDAQGELIGAVHVARDISEIKEAQEALEDFSKGLEAKVKQRTFELSILYEVSNAISYTLDYRQLFKFIMDSLFKIVDYDLCASLLFDTRTANITIKPAYPRSVGFVDEVKNGLINSTSTLTGEDIRKKQLSTFLIPLADDAKLEEERGFDNIRSFFNVPFVVEGKTIGMLNVSSCKDSAFTENDLKLIYTIANQATSAIERLQALLMAEKTKMKSMVESMAEGVIMTDEQGKIVVINPQARQMLGFGVDKEITSRGLNEKMDAIGLNMALKECQKEEKLVTKEIIIPYQKKSLTLHCDITPVKDTEGETIGIVTILRDITMEREVDRMKTEFISTASHELRTPLTSMKEAISLVLDEIIGSINEKQKEFLSMAKADIDRLARMINEMLDLSRIESGRVELKTRLMSIISIIEKVTDSFRPQADAVGVILTFHAPAHLPKIYFDAEKITEVIANILNNAISFTPQGGRVNLQVKEEAEEIVVSVEDTGVGIPGQDLPKVFERFQQLDSVAPRKRKGSGLGLAICKAIVQMHHGKIWVESEEGKGTKISFSLPKHTVDEHFQSHLNKRLKESDDKGIPLTLIMVIVKNFEEIRKTLGQGEADRVLKEIELAAKRKVRGDDILSWYKTGEVVIIMCKTNKQGAMIIKKRLMQELKKIKFITSTSEAIDVNSRIGMATYPDEATTQEELVLKAEERGESRE